MQNEDTTQNDNADAANVSSDAAQAASEQAPAQSAEVPGAPAVQDQDEAAVEAAAAAASDEEKSQDLADESLVEDTTTAGAVATPAPTGAPPAQSAEVPGAPAPGPHDVPVVNNDQNSAADNSEPTAARSLIGEITDKLHHLDQLPAEIGAWFKQKFTALEVEINKIEGEL